MRSKHVFIMVFASLIVCGAWFLAQQQRRMAFSKHLLCRVQAAAGWNKELVNFAALTSFKWDRVIFFPPYTNAEQINNALGYSWMWASFTGIQKSEGHYLIVFMKSNRVVQHCMFKRAHGDFKTLKGGSWMSRDNAVFLVKQAFDGELPARLVMEPFGALKP